MNQLSGKSVTRINLSRTTQNKHQGKEKKKMQHTHRLSQLTVHAVIEFGKTWMNLYTEIYMQTMWYACIILQILLPWIYAPIIHKYTNIFVYTRTYTYACYVHTYEFKYIYKYIRKPLCAYIMLQTLAFLNIYAYTHIHIICTQMNTYAYYIHIYVHTQVHRSSTYIHIYYL